MGKEKVQAQAKAQVDRYIGAGDSTKEIFQEEIHSQKYIYFFSAACVVSYQIKKKEKWLNVCFRLKSKNWW